MKYTIVLPIVLFKSSEFLLGKVTRGKSKVLNAISLHVLSASTGESIFAHCEFIRSNTSIVGKLATY